MQMIKPNQNKFICKIVNLRKNTILSSNDNILVYGAIKMYLDIAPKVS